MLGRYPQPSPTRGSEMKQGVERDPQILIFCCELNVMSPQAHVLEEITEPIGRWSLLGGYSC